MAGPADENQLISLYREIWSFKQVTDAKSDFTLLCPNCKNLRPQLLPVTLSDIGLQACYDCLKKVCYPQCGQFWYSYSISWPKKVFLCVLCLKKREFLKKTGLWYTTDTGLLPGHASNSGIHKVGTQELRKYSDGGASQHFEPNFSENILPVCEEVDPIDAPPKIITPLVADEESRRKSSESNSLFSKLSFSVDSLNSDDTSKISNKKSSSSLRSAKLINLSQKSLDFTDDELVESIHVKIQKEDFQKNKDAGDSSSVFDVKINFEESCSIKKGSGSSHKTSYSKTSSINSSQVKRTSSESSGADDVIALIRNELNQERWLQEAIKENIERSSRDNSMSSLNDVMDDEETQNLREILPPDIDDYIGHSRLLRKYSFDIEAADIPSVLQTRSGYVGIRVVGGKTIGNRMVAKVLTVRLGSPADKWTSIKPGDLVIMWNDVLLLGKTFEQTQEIVDDFKSHTRIVVAYQTSSQIEWHMASRQQSFQCSNQILRRAIMSRRANLGMYFSDLYVLYTLYTV